MPKKQMPHPELVPSVKEYVAGFKKIEASLNDQQKQLLRNHHDSPGRVTTATALGKSVGFANYRGTNLQYGRLSKMLADAMGVEYWTLSMLVTFVPPRTASNGHWQLVMRENVALALEELSWAQKNSHLFFPNEAPPVSSSAEAEEPPAK